MHSAILTHGASAHEVAKGGASSLSKLALSARSTAGSRGAVECGLAEGEMHTTTCSGCKPIVKWVQTNSGTGAYHYSFVVQTYSGSRVD